MKDGFPRAARAALADSQLRRNLGHATTTIRDKRARVVAEVPDWEALRDAGAEIKDRALRHLDVHLERLEEAVQARRRHRALGARRRRGRRGRGRRRPRPRRQTRSSRSSRWPPTRSTSTTASRRSACTRWRPTWPSSSSSSPTTRPRTSSSPPSTATAPQIAELFRRELGVEVSDDPAELTAAARAHLRAKFLSVPVGVSGANFAVAETGHVVVLESEGNGRMCTTLPEVLVSVVGIEKILPRWRDLEVMLQLLPRSSTGERMNPYTSIWSGVADGDGPREFHLVLLDAGRTDVLADEVGRAALRCIRCSACLNVCPVYERTGGHAYESVYPGPIGAILTPQLQGLENAPTLPWASSLCGACYEVCPVKIDIPSILVHLRGRVVREVGAPVPERAAMAAMARVFASRRAYEAAQRAAKLGRGPLAGAALRPWTRSRELPEVPKQTFRDWWRDERA